jgi:hypothetical protein
LDRILSHSPCVRVRVCAHALVGVCLCARRVLAVRVRVVNVRVMRVHVRAVAVSVCFCVCAVSPLFLIRHDGR